MWGIVYVTFKVYLLTLNFAQECQENEFLDRYEAHFIIY